MKHYKIFSLIFIAVTTIISVCSIAIFSSPKTVKACTFTDDKYGYVLTCTGDKGYCKFINPDNDAVICRGNNADAQKVDMQ